MSNISILIGTMLGASEYVADHLTEILESDHQVSNYLTPDLKDLDLTIPQVWIVCTSTHGAGEFPDSIRPFVEQLTQQQPDLSKIRFAICALGDSSYDTFCQAGKDMDNLLESLKGQRITPMNLIDVSLGELPEDNAEQWLLEWKDQLVK